MPAFTAEVVAFPIPNKLSPNFFIEEAVPKNALPRLTIFPAAAPPAIAIIIPCNTGVGNLAIVSANVARMLTKAVKTLVTPSLDANWAKD